MFTKQDADTTKGSVEAAVVFSDDLIKLLPKSQYRSMRDNPREHAEYIKRMNKIAANIPKLYETDQPNALHPLSLHYFVGGCDWYIAEWDRGDQFFGYAILNGDYDNSEWGSISVSELLSLEIPRKYLMVNLDFHCVYKTIEEALFARDKKHFWKYDPAYLEAQNTEGE
ncbi:hypothetical protein AGMMS49579_26950 [Spirochaetia bacterium]|nr:hypothetical protein AGMMS49579_26950 [Spirochaetia bacterium]